MFFWWLKCTLLLLKKIFGRTPQHAGSSSLTGDPSSTRVEPTTLQWECGILTTGPPERSPNVHR